MEAVGASGEEVGFRERAVEVVAAAQEVLEHGVVDGDPLDDEVAACEAMAERENLGEGDLLHQKEVMDDREHEDKVELSLETRQQGEGFVVHPADGGSGAGDVCVDGLDGEIALAGHAEEAVRGGLVALQGDDLCAERGGQRTEFAGVGTDVEDAGGLRRDECMAHPVELLPALFGSVVGEGLRVVAPVGGDEAGCSAESAAAKDLEGAAKDVVCDLGRVDAGFLLRCGGILPAIGRICGARSGLAG